VASNSACFLYLTVESCVKLGQACACMVNSSTWLASGARAAVPHSDTSSCVQLHQAGKTTNAALDERNSIVAMANAGSKGSMLNISQIIACVGQQNVEGQVGLLSQPLLPLSPPSLFLCVRDVVRSRLRTSCHVSLPRYVWCAVAGHSASRTVSRTVRCPTS
jgi:ureidoglycolate hydrolase